MTGRVAHDFNNLLTVILGNIDLLQTESRGDDDPSLLISAMQSAAERGVQLTSQLLAFSRQKKLLQVTLSVHRSILDIASRNVTVGAFEAARLDVAPGDYIQVAVTDSGHRYRSKRAAASLRAVLHDKGHRQGERASVSRKSTALPSNPAEPRRSTAPSERARR